MNKLRRLEKGKVRDKLVLPSCTSYENPINIMFDGIERLRRDHDIQFIVKHLAFISMGSKMLYNMLTLYCPGVWLRPGLDHDRVHVSLLTCVY